VLSKACGVEEDSSETGVNERSAACKQSDGQSHATEPPLNSAHCE